MTLDIGEKIKTSRKEAGFTQEDAADGIGVSRQTILSWENNKSYPDIISVIKMSDIYNVSLDYLLKGEKNMSNYYNYLEESTNVVKRSISAAWLRGSSGLRLGRMTDSMSSCFSSFSRLIFSSTVPRVTNLKICTARFWPMRWARSVA